VIVLSASFSDSGLLIVRVMLSAYAVSLGGLFGGFGTGEMEELAWMWVMSGLRARNKRVGLNGSPCRAPLFIGIVSVMDLLTWI